MQQPRDVDSTEHESEGYDDYDEANFEELYTSCEDAAGALRCFWAQPAHAKLLAKPLPFSYNAEQLIVVYLGAQQVMNLQVAVLEAEQTRTGMNAQGLVGPSEQALLQATFTHQPVVPLARLLVWLQKRPDLLQLHKLEAEISSTAANSSDTPLQPYAALWYRSAMGLSRLLQLAVTWHERSGCGIDVLQQIQQQLTKYGLPEQLPKFLQQLVGFLQAQQQPLKGIPISTAMNLAAYMMQLLLQRDCVTVQDISWRWAADMLQQMVQCAQAAGLMRILVSRAALTGSSSSSSVAGLGSGSSSGVDDTAQAMCADVISSGLLLMQRQAAAMEQVKTAPPPARQASDALVLKLARDLMPRPCLVEFLLQLLASRCLLLHKHLQQQQQQQQSAPLRLSQQLGKHMRGDLLLLPDPRQQLHSWLQTLLL